MGNLLHCLYINFRPYELSILHHLKTRRSQMATAAAPLTIAVSCVCGVVASARTSIDETARAFGFGWPK